MQPAKPSWNSRTNGTHLLLPWLIGYMLTDWVQESAVAFHFCFLVGNQFEAGLEPSIRLFRSIILAHTQSQLIFITKPGEWSWFPINCPRALTRRLGMNTCGVTGRLSITDKFVLESSNCRFCQQLGATPKSHVLFGVTLQPSAPKSNWKERRASRAMVNFVIWGQEEPLDRRARWPSINLSLEKRQPPLHFWTNGRPKLTMPKWATS